MDVRVVFVSFLLVCVSLTVSAAAKLTVPQLPGSPYDDTEISTNVVFIAGDYASRSLAFALELDAFPSNTVQLAFGTDADSDGNLSWRETEFLVGWRCGGWFFRDKAFGAEGFAARETGHRTLDWKLTFGPDFTPHALAAKDGAQDLGFTASGGMFNPAWNLIRVTMRGTPGPIYSVDGGVFAPGFAIRLR